MDLLKQTFESFNPNFETIRKYTIKLGDRQWETTNIHECGRFILSFCDDYDKKTVPFKMSSAPYSGSPINTVINTKQ